MDILHPDIENYLLEIAPKRDAVVVEMEVLAKVRHFPIVGPLVGRFLHQLVLITHAQRILEMGSGFGYSAYWMAKALGDGGTIICTERSPLNAEVAREFFKKGGVQHKIDFRVGDALEIIDQLEGPFDLIMNDIDKEHYPDAFRKAVPKLRKGGVLVADNLLWSGQVLSKTPDKATMAIIAFTKMIHESPELFTTVIPLRDGISVSLKIA